MKHHIDWKVVVVEEVLRGETSGRRSHSHTVATIACPHLQMCLREGEILTNL